MVLHNSQILPRNLDIFENIIHACRDTCLLKYKYITQHSLKFIFDNFSDYAYFIYLCLGTLASPNGSSCFM